MRTVGSRVPPTGAPLRTDKRNRPYETLRVVETASVTTQAAKPGPAWDVLSADPAEGLVG